MLSIQPGSRVLGSAPPALQPPFVNTHMSADAPPCTFCSIHEPCRGLHDPFVCRVVPAALRWLYHHKAADPDFLAPPGLIDAILTQTMHYAHAYDQDIHLTDFCEYVAHNYLEFFDAVYRNEFPNLRAFDDYLKLVTAQTLDSFFCGGSNKT